MGDTGPPRIGVATVANFRLSERSGYRAQPAPQHEPCSDNRIAEPTVETLSTADIREVQGQLVDLRSANDCFCDFGDDRSQTRVTTFNDRQLPVLPLTVN
jgi:hypothetical protein